MTRPARAARALVVGLLLVGASGARAADGLPAAPPLPTDSSRWVGPPTSWDALRGRVTLVFVWTFG